jgi:hypothetical protein
MSAPGTKSHGAAASAETSRAPTRRVPQLGVGSGIPRPRKLRDLKHHRTRQQPCSADDHRRRNVRQQAADEDASLACATGARREHELPAPQGQDPPSDDARHSRPTDGRQTSQDGEDPHTGRSHGLRQSGPDDEQHRRIRRPREGPVEKRGQGRPDRRRARRARCTATLLWNTLCAYCVAGGPNMDVLKVAPRSSPNSVSGAIVGR